MAYNTLKSNIQGDIQNNTSQTITGQVLQDVLLEMVDSLGAGYQFMGIATPATNPGTPDEKVFYIASGVGTYTNFNNLVVNEGEVAILKWSSAWSKEVTGAATTDQLNRLGLQVDDTAQFIEDLQEEVGYTPATENLFDYETAVNCHLFKSGSSLIYGPSASLSIQSYIIPVTPNSIVTVDHKYTGSRFALYSCAEYPAVGVTPVQTIGDNSATSLRIVLGATERYLLVYVNNTSTDVDVSQLRVYYGDVWVEDPSFNLYTRENSRKVTGVVNIADSSLSGIFDYTNESGLPILGALKGVALMDYHYTSDLYILRMWKQATTDKVFIQFSADGSTILEQVTSVPFTGLSGIVAYPLPQYGVILYLDASIILAIEAANTNVIGYKFKWDALKASALTHTTIAERKAIRTADVAKMHLDKPFAKIPIIIFRSDDGVLSGDSALADVLDSYGIKCMFGLIGDTVDGYGAATYMAAYKDMERNGHNIVSHGYSTDAFTSLTESALIENILAEQEKMHDYGVYPTGVIYPDGLRSDAVDAVLKKVYSYSIIGGNNYINDDPTSFVIYTASYETKTLAEMKTCVDDLIANGSGVLCFGGHSYRIGDTQYTQNTLADIAELCQYIKAKMDALQVKSISPDLAIREMRG